MRILPHAVIIALLLGGSLPCRAEKPKDPFDTVALAPNGKHVFIGMLSGKVAMLELATGDTIRVFEHHKGEAPAITLSQDGTRMVTAPPNVLAKELNQVVMWETDTGKPVWKFDDHKDKVKAAAISPDGKRVVSGDDKGAVMVWEPRTDGVIRTFQDHKTWVRSIVISRNGKWLFTGSYDKTVIVYDFAKLEKVKTLSTGVVNCLAASADGKRLLLAQGGSKASLWDVEAGKEIRSFEFDKKSGVELVALSADGKTAVTTGHNDPAVIWNADTRERRHYLWGPHWGSKYGVWALDLSADGKRLAAQSHGFVTLWDVEKGEDIDLYADPYQ